MASIVPLFVILPLGVAFLIAIAPRAARRAPDVLGNVTLLVLAVLAFCMLAATKVVLIHMGGVEAPLGIDLRLDPLAVLMLLTINVIGLAVTLFSVDYMRTYTARLRYYALLLLMIVGMNGVVLTGDLFNLFVFMEVAAVSSYALVGFGCGHEELEASFKYIVLGSVASALILVGVALTYGVTGSLNMVQISERVAQTGMTPPLLFSLALFVAGFGLKAALVPFHAWLPDAHSSAPAPVSAMLSGVVIKSLGVYVLARLLFNVFGMNADILNALRWLGFLSMVVGVLLAVGQWDMKRLFAYHSISQIGYVVLGLGLGTPLGIVGALFHLVNHSVFKSLLFLNAGAVEQATGTRDLKRLGGLNRSMPVTGYTSLVASLSIAGVPPFNGFWSKLIIVMACVQSGFYGMALWAVLVSLVTLVSFLKVQRYAFFGAPKASAREAVPTPWLMAAPMVALAVLCLVMSLLAVAGLEEAAIIRPAADVLLRGKF